MNLRPYQERAVSATAREVQAPASTTLTIAPTASGKSRMMTATADRTAPLGNNGWSVLVVQHRDELVDQNRDTFAEFLPAWNVATFDAVSKTFATGPLNATFAMDKSLSAFIANGVVPPRFDLLLLDEAHHAASPSWRAFIAVLRLINPALRISGWTATPERGDGKPLGVVFATIADQIDIAEIMADGWLVPPRALVADIGIGQRLESVRRTNRGQGDYDEHEVATLLSDAAILNRVLDLWESQAKGKKTIFFCATTAQARTLVHRLEERGHGAGIVTDKTSKARRKKVLATAPHLVNVMTLTEGFNDPAIECVVILRRCAFRGLVIQIIGRGMRLFPGKTECLVLDFGASLSTLGGLDRVFELSPDKAREPGTSPMKSCPKCLAAISTSARLCVLCGYVYQIKIAPKIELPPAEIHLRAYEIVLKESPFSWIDLPDKHGRLGRAKIAAPGKVWSLVFQDGAGTWHAFAGGNPESKADLEYRIPQCRYLAGGDINAALSHADHFLGQHADAKKYGRGTGFMRLAASEKQLALAKKRRITLGRGTSMYRAQCLITADLNRATIAASMADIRSVA